MENDHCSGEMAAGIDNLLQRCARVQSGQTLLIIGESGENTYFDHDLCRMVQQAANARGIHTTVEYARPGADASSSLPVRLSKKMASADVTLFFSRLGDQIRFMVSPGQGSKVMCYTLTKAHLGAPFATLNHHKMTAMQQILETRIRNASHYQITTRCGTRLTGEIISDNRKNYRTEFHVELFPTMIFPPINCHRLAGDLTLSRFITSTSTRAYADSVLMIESPVTARVENSVIVALDGDSDTVRLIDRQLNRGGALSGGDPYVLHSWHTGINPGTFFDGDPLADLEYWGTVAYGSPRYTHLHAAGRAPGDVAYHLIDATIRFDDELLWHHGQFVFLDTPQIQSLFTSDERRLIHSKYRLGIGL